MPIPRIAIVGRPNVGKSSLLNRLVGRRVSIVEPTPGVTRDRVTARVDHGGRTLEFIDTGGLGLVDEELLRDHIETQIQLALHASDLILFVVDAKEGRVPGDQLVAERLRRLGKPVLLIANKIESHWEELGVHEWERFGFGAALPTSALEGFGISEVMDAVQQRLPASDDGVVADDDGDALRFAVVGKRNSGKSTLVNRLAGEERVIVSEIPGTTRDSIDVLFEDRGRRLLAIDTAGVRKKSSIENAIELFSHARATASIRRAQIVVHMFDVREPISQVDKKLAAYCVEQHKPVLLVGNKVDLADRVDLDRWDAYIRQQLPGLHFAPVSFMSAKDGTNVERTLDLLFELRLQARTEISTARLNEELHEATQQQAPRSQKRPAKLFYGTQIGTEPLTILIFVNDPQLFKGQWERYLQSRLRTAFGCPEVPIRLIFRRRQKVELAQR